MTGQQMGKLFEDYGVGFGAVIAVVLLALALVKAWPMISALVQTVNLLVKLDTRLEGMESTMEGNTGKLDTTIVKLSTLDTRLIAVEERTKDIKHEVKNNGGSSMKDAVHRNGDALAEAVDILRRLDPTSTGTLRIRPKTGPIEVQ